MKKLYMGVVAGLLLLAGCSDNDENFVQGDEGVRSITSLTATIGDSPNTRAFIVNGEEKGKKDVAWSENDKILVFSDTQQKFRTYQLEGVDDNVGTFGGSMVRGNQFFYATYPDEGWQFDGTVEGRLNFDFSSKISTNDESYLFRGPMVAVYTGSENNDGAHFAFKQLTGMVHVSVAGLFGVSSVGIEGNNSEIISGPAYVDYVDAEPTLILDENKARTKAFGMGFPDANGIADLYFILAPMTFTNGFKIFVEGYDELGNPVSFTKTYSQELVIDRGTVKHFPVINVDDREAADPVGYSAIVPDEQAPNEYTILGTNGTAYAYSFNSETHLPQRLTLYSSNKEDVLLQVNFADSGLPINILTNEFTIVMAGHEDNTFRAILIGKDGETAIYEDVKLADDFAWQSYVEDLESDASAGVVSQATISRINAVIGAVGCALSTSGTIASSPTGIGAVAGWGLATINSSSPIVGLVDAIEVETPISTAISDPVIVSLFDDITTRGEWIYDQATADIELGENTLISGNGDIKITLTWDNYADIDLHVVDPTGYHIYYRDMQSPSGGYLDYDNTVAYGPENIYFDPAVSGTYYVYLHYYEENQGINSVNYKVTIYKNGVGRTYEGTITGKGSVVDIERFTYGSATTRTFEDCPVQIDWNNLPKKR